MKLLLSIALILPFNLWAQSGREEKKQANFYRMVDALLDHTVDEIKVTDDIPNDAVLLDARSIAEFRVSHIMDARFVGYDNFNLHAVEDLDKQEPIIVYCSVGYRSEKVAEKLKAAGFENVKNLYGGLFDWANQDKPVVDSLGNEVNQVHGYNKNWGRWLDQSKVVY